MSRIRRTIAAATVVSGAVLGLLGAGAGVTSAAVPPDASGFVILRADGVNMRTCASTSCTSVGLAYRSQALFYYCQSQTAPAPNGWIRIWNDSTNRSGWISNRYAYYGCD